MITRSSFNLYCSTILSGYQISRLLVFENRCSNATVIPATNPRAIRGMLLSGVHRDQLTGGFLSTGRGRESVASARFEETGEEKPVPVELHRSSACNLHFAAYSGMSLCPTDASSKVQFFLVDRPFL